MQEDWGFPSSARRVKGVRAIGEPGEVRFVSIPFGEFADLYSLFWVTGPFGMIQREDFWDTIAKNVHVHRNDIDRLEEHTVIFDDGSSIPVDVIICCTGFQNNYSFFDEKQRIRLGLPHARMKDIDEESWELLEADAEKSILQRYPKLAAAPNSGRLGENHNSKQMTPNRMYHLIAPLDDDSIAFMGNVYVPNGFRIAEAQAIWTTAYLDGKVELPPKEEMRKEIARVTTYIRRRYPKQGELGNYILYDVMGYVDKLFSEVGLTSHRKGWWSDLVYPVVVKDLHGTTKEYLEKHGGGVQASAVG